MGDAKPEQGQFALRTVEEWFGKMTREFTRVTSDDDDPLVLSDHCVNFAITAWHMHEWVWSAIKDDVKGNLVFLTELDKPAGRATEQDFIAWTTAKEPALVWCQGICNGSKHVGANRGEKPLTTRVSATSLTVIMPIPGKRGKSRSVQVPGPWWPKIIDETGNHRAIPLFQRVVGFWGGFLRGRGFKL